MTKKQSRQTLFLVILQKIKALHLLYRITSFLSTSFSKFFKTFLGGSGGFLCHLRGFRATSHATLLKIKTHF